MASVSRQVPDGQRNKETGESDGQDRPPRRRLGESESIGQIVPDDVLELVHRGQEAECDE
ncbi:hypothetical protein [Aeromicrobium sp. UC242_57]|uniref:hypothetical protein n=1 Tax=Aeromicrobium sp. UC242_57 TaxID=3374624 RepID=UPI0037891848